MTSFDWAVLGTVLLGNGIIWMGAVLLLYRKLEDKHDVTAAVLSKHCDPERDEYVVTFSVNGERLSLQTSPEMYARLQPNHCGTLTYAGDAMVAFRVIRR